MQSWCTSYWRGTHMLPQDEDMPRLNLACALLLLRHNEVNHAAHFIMGAESAKNVLSRWKARVLLLFGCHVLFKRDYHRGSAYLERLCCVCCCLSNCITLHPFIHHHTIYVDIYGHVAGALSYYTQSVSMSELERITVYWFVVRSFHFLQ